MLRWILLLLLGAGPVFAGPEADLHALPEALKGNEDVQSVMTSRYIHVTLDDGIGVAYERALQLFEQPDILALVQEEYARQLEGEEEPEFVVQSDGPGSWSYENRKGQVSEIREIFRDLQPDASRLIYYTRGERFFGWFRALTDVRIRPDPDQPGACRYDVDVYAYPEVAVARFFARHLGLVERYFNRKTGDVTELTVRICNGLFESGPVAATGESGGVAPLL